MCCWFYQEQHIARRDNASPLQAIGRTERTWLLRPPDLQFPARALGFHSLPQFARAVGSLLATAGRGFLNGLFDRFTCFAGALLNAPQQFIMLALGALEIVIRELSPLLLQLAFGDVPVALDFECSHIALFCLFVNRRQWDGRSVSAADLCPDSFGSVSGSSANSRLACFQ
jgi:hypothetical protein